MEKFVLEVLIWGIFVVPIIFGVIRHFRRKLPPGLVPPPFYCINCGAKNPSDARVCRRCGRSPRDPVGPKTHHQVKSGDPVSALLPKGMVGWLIFLVMMFFVYLGLDSIGWVPHNEDTTITAEASWLVGESKECVSYPLDAKTAAAAGKEAGYAFHSVFCDSGPYRNVRVRFRGRVNQPEYDAVTWKCTREEAGFTCYELSGHRPGQGP